jgi:hypothetical protein
MTEKEIQEEKIRCEKVSFKIVKIPDDYEREIKTPNTSKLPGSSLSKPNSE